VEQMNKTFAVAPEDASALHLQFDKYKAKYPASLTPLAQASGPSSPRGRLCQGDESPQFHDDSPLHTMADFDLHSPSSIFQVQSGDQGSAAGATAMANDEHAVQEQYNLYFKPLINEQTKQKTYNVLTGDNQGRKQFANKSKKFLNITNDERTDFIRKACSIK
jgi:hypothetical protein